MDAPAPQSALRTFLQDLLQKSPMTRLQAGNGPTRTDLLAEQYSK